MEGAERELVSRIQTMRKEAGFEVTDRIEVYYKAEGRALAVLKSGAFAKDVLASKVLPFSGEVGFTKTLDVNGDKAEITIVRV